MRRALVVILTLLIGTVALALVATPAAATDGSVPKVVSDYITTDLADALNEFYGPDTDGGGTLFEDSTSYTATSRVWAWTPEFDAGIADQPAERRLNEWVTVVSVREVVIGVATVAIDPVTNGPQLANFLASPELAAAIGAAPATSMLLRDPQRQAWLAVEGETITPLVAGLSGIAAPTTVAVYRARVAVQRPAEQQPVAEPVSSDGLLVLGIVVVLIVALLALEAFFPFWRRLPFWPRLSSWPRRPFWPQRRHEVAQDPDDHVL